MVGFNLQDVIENRALRVATQVPVAVMHEIHNRRHIGASVCFPDEFIRVAECISDRYIEIAWVAFLTVERTIAKNDGIAAELARPKYLVETLSTAVKMAGDASWCVIEGELVAFAIERAFPIANAIAETTHGRTET